MNIWLSTILALVGSGLSAQSVDTLLLPSEKFGRTIVVLMYQTKQYPVQTLYTEGGHDFDNWNAQWEDVLSFLLRYG